MHYTRWRRHGDPLTDMRDARNLYWTRDDGELVLTMLGRDGCRHDVLYSAESAALVMARRWHLSDEGYAISFTLKHEGTERHPLRMHRVVLELGPEDPRVDHINGNRLDNRLSNLRLGSSLLNAANRAVINYRGTSRYRGVSRDRDVWVAYAKVNYRKHHLGRFATEEDAAAAVAAFRQERGLPSY